MSSEALRWNTISGSIGSLLAFAGLITVISVVATVVRRHRPDAYQPLLVWSIAQLVVYGVNVIGYPVLGVIAHGSDSYMTAMAMFRIVMSIVHLGVILLLVRGLVAIAQPPKPFKVESDAPYR